MFKKILIVEGLDSISIGLSTSLASNFTAEINTAKSSDEAIVKIKKAVYEKLYFDMVIFDPSYIDCHSTDSRGDEEFINNIRRLLPLVKIMVYSSESKPFRIHKLFHKQKINAFIAKGRDSVHEIIEGIKRIYDSDIIYISPKFSTIIEKKNSDEIEDFDIKLLKYLSIGKTQADISTLFKEQGLQNSSTSSIEKRINRLRILLKANNSIHLIAIAKDLGII